MKTRPKYQNATLLKGILVILFIGLLQMSCEKEVYADIEAEELTSVEHKARWKNKIKICHSRGYGRCRIINISENAWNAHKRHGDVRLDDNGSCS